LSFNIRNIREISNEPQTKFINQLAKKLSKFLTEQEVEKLEGKEDIYSNAEDVESIIKHHTFGSTKYFDFQTMYYPPVEPDGDKVTCWVKGDNIGGTVNDISGFANHGTVNGDPILVDGAPFDYGIHTGGNKSIALRFNRPTSSLENQEYIIIPDAVNLGINGIATGMSYFIRFKLGSIVEQNGWGRTLFEKVDDNTPDNAIRVLVADTGRITVRIKRGGTQYNSQTAASTIAAGTVYEVFITYAVSGNITHVYVNNVDKTLSDPGTSTNWHGDLSNHDLAIFARGVFSDNGRVYGDLYDYMIYREKVVSAAEVGYHFTNKWTIGNIAYGHVLVSDYWATYVEPAQAAYTTTGYTTVGYNT